MVNPTMMILSHLREASSGGTEEPAYNLSESLVRNS